MYLPFKPRHTAATNQDADALDSTPEWLKRNSSIGPNLTALGALAWYNANSLRSIKILLAFFGVKVCKRTVENMITSTIPSMKKEVGKILENTKFGKMDETPITVENHQGYVWVCVGDDTVSIHASHTRSAIVPEQRYWFCLDKPITVDRFAGYNGFKLRQCCWSHILREAEHSIDCHAVRKAADAISRGQTHPYDVIVNGGICTKSCRCYFTRPNIWVPPILLQAGQDVLHSKLGSKFGTKLGNAADNLYTIVSHSGMHPTNNKSERMLRKVVIHRKIRQRLVTNGGMRIFEVIS